MAGYLPSSLAHPSGHTPENRSLGPDVDSRMPIPSPTLSSKKSYMKPLDKEKASRNFNSMIKWFFSIDQNTTKDDIIRFLVGLDILSDELSYFPMTLVLHGTQDYDKSDDAYRMAEEATSRFTAAIHLITGRLNILQPEKSMDPAELKPEEQGRLSQILECGEKGTLHGCLQALYNDFTERLNHFSPPSNAGLPKSLSNVFKEGWGLSLEACPAWLTSTPPWVFVPSAFHVLSLLSNGIENHSTRVIVDWIMCITIELSNVSRKKRISTVHKSIMRKAVYLLEDKIKETVNKSTYKSYDPLSIHLYRKFEHIVDNDKAIRHPHLDYKKNNDSSIIDQTTPSSYSYNTLELLRPFKFRSSSTNSPISSRQRAKASRLKHEAVLGDLAWSKLKGKILEHATVRWIKEYIDDYTKGRELPPSDKNYSSCYDLLKSLIPMAIQGVTGDQGIQKEMGEEVRGFLTKRTLNMHPKSTRPLEEGKAPLSNASNWAYRSFMSSWKFRINQATGFPFCIRDFFYIIHRSYLSHRTLIDSMKDPSFSMRFLASSRKPFH
ncbi:MAG: hypothetical protein DHS80DRAFT_25127 [Piptocephalis tieghemiana]|nr:MAG: hypothetical protein DHS80DRAFT_25127 [Piptocephalis tieghemiana]